MCPMDPFSFDGLPSININCSPSSQPDLFNKIGFCVSGTINTKLLRFLENGGAKQRAYAGVGVTHFFAAPDADEIKVEEVKDIFEVPIVAPRWITYSVLLQRVLPTNGFNGEFGQLFSSITAATSGARGSDLKNIWTGLTYYGGNFSKVLTEKCTHLITNSCTGKKYQIAQEAGIVIVCFDWLSESILKGKLEDTKLYHPSLLILPVKVNPPEIPTPSLQRETVQPRPPLQVGVRPGGGSAQHWTQQQQAEIIRQIQSDPQIKQQWGQMDHQQRTLLIQKLAQRNREDHLRREMMIRQQQMNLQNAAGQQRHHVNQNLSPVGSQGSSAASLPQSGGISSQMSKPNVSPVPIIQKIQPVISSSPQQVKPVSQEHQSLLNSPIIMNFENRQQHNNYSQHGINSHSPQLKHSQQQNSQPAGHPQSRQIPRQIIASQVKQFSSQIYTPSLTSPMSNQHEVGSQDQTIRLQISETPIQFSHKIISPQQQNFEAVVKTEQQIFSPHVAQQNQDRILKHQLPSQISQQNVFQSHSSIENETCSQPSPTNSLPQQTEGSVRSDQVFPSNQRILIPQHQSPNAQQQQHKFFQSQGQELQLQKQPPGQQTGVAEMIRTQQIFSPHFSHQNQQRINVRHVFVHQGDQPRLQQQHIILQQQNNSQEITISSSHQQQKIAVLPAQSQGATSQWISSPTRQTTNNNQSPSQVQHIRPLVIDPSPSTIPQQWTSPVRHQSQPHGNIIYTTGQPNLPFVQVVNPKTKTALANLLSNRLQGSNGSEIPTTLVPVSSPQQGQSPTTPPISQIHHTVSPPSVAVTCQQNLTDRRTLSNLTNSGKPQHINTPAQVASQPLTLPSSRAQFYGHDPNIKLPPDGFFLGCIFWTAQPMESMEWEKCVEQYGGELEMSYCARVTHVICSTQKFPEFHQCVREGKRMVTLHWLSDICIRKCVVSPFYALHLPVPITGDDRPLEGEYLSISGFSVEDKARVRVMCEILGAAVTPFFTMRNMALVAHKPEGVKYQKAREWKKPVINVQFLNELMFGQNVSTQMIHSPKYQHFNLEQPFRCDIGLVGQLMAAWKIPIRVNSDSFEKYRYRKRSLENKDESEHCKRMRSFNADKEMLSSYLTPVEGNSLKKDSPPIVPIIIMSGFSRVYKDKLQENIETLGGRVTEDVFQATHLVTKLACRSKKLFVCLSRVSHIASSTWIYDSLPHGKFLDVSEYTLQDPQFELVFGRKFEDILSSPNRNSLFAGLTFYLTPSIDPTRTAMRDIIEGAGGQVDVSQHSLKSIRTLGCATRKYIVITCTADHHLFGNTLYEKELGKIAMYDPDDVISSIIHQELVFQ